jgi:Flp pilus assembly protein TadD
VCKETIAAAPLLVALYDRVFLYRSWRDAAQARGSLYAGLGASWLVLAGVVLSGPRAAVSGFASGVPVWTYLLNQAAILVDYLRLTVWPTNLVVLYGWPEPLTLGDVLPQALAIVALLAITAVALVRAPRLGYLGAWAFVVLAPASSIVPIATEVGAERRMYVPLMALVVLAVLGVNTVRSRVVRVAVLVLLVTALGALTIRRNTEYASAITLAQTVVDRRPTAIAHHLLGEQYGLAGRAAEAERELRAAVALGTSRARFQLGTLLVDAQRWSEAASELEAFVATAGVPQRLTWLEPPLIDVLTARLQLAQIYGAERRWADMAAQARMVLEYAPRHPEALRLLSIGLVGAQVWPEAVTVIRDYLALRPTDTTARSNLAIALIATGRLDEAVAELQRATQTDPNDDNARRLLNMALADQRARVR